MQAVSKGNHEKFCKQLQHIRTTQLLPESSISELEKELNDIFQAYQQQLNNLKTLIMEYNVKERIIRQKVKRLLRADVTSQI